MSKGFQSMVVKALSVTFIKIPGQLLDELTIL